MKKILIPVDGSGASIKAAKTAAELAAKDGSKLTFVVVVDEVGYGTAIGDVPITKDYTIADIQQLKDENLVNAKKILDKVIEQAVPSDLKVEKKILSGMVAGEISREAKAGNYDLIVMGRRGLSKMERFFIGSVTQRVLAETPCAVYIEKEDT